MARYVEKAGGWEFIRRMADWHWQLVVDHDGYEARSVDQYYALAGWDHPPKKRVPPSATT